jgi:hypothetical protein
MSVATSWKGAYRHPDTTDPFALAEYVQRKIFLSDINNEREEKNPVYKQRILDLESFVMSYSTIDEVHSACTLLAVVESEHS